MSISTASSTVATLTRYRFVAVGSETSVSGVDANGSVLGYTVGMEQVYLNGVMLVRGSDYTASTGTSITALSALAANDVVEVLTFSPFTITNAVDQTLVNAKGDIIAATGDNVVTNVAIGSNNTLLVADSAQTAGLKWTSAITSAQLVAPREFTTVSATAATGTIQFDLSTQGVLYYTTNSTGNFTLNFRGNSGTTLNSVMAVGDAISAVFMCTNSTAYYLSSNPTVDTNATVSVKWSGGTAAAAGNASSIDAYSFTIIKTATSTFTVLIGGPVKFA